MLNSDLLLKFCILLKDFISQKFIFELSKTTIFIFFFAKEKDIINYCVYILLLLASMIKFLSAYSIIVNALIYCHQKHSASKIV